MLYRGKLVLLLLHIKVSTHTNTAKGEEPYAHLQWEQLRLNSEFIRERRKRLRFVHVLRTGTSRWPALRMFRMFFCSGVDDQCVGNDAGKHLEGYLAASCGWKKSWETS